MVKIKFLGACQEVGRSGVLIESEETQDAILCDYGTKMDDEGQQFPAHISGRNLSCIVLTHSHIDHCGGIPLFYISGSVPLICTKLTFEVTEILIHDMLKISQAYLPFEREELYKMRQYAQFLDYGKRKRVGRNSYVTLINAGHIPGSAMVLVEMDGKSILYTGDINTVSTQLLPGLDVNEVPPLDAIITETTYGTSDHLPREETENQLIENVNKTLESQGTVLIPAFGVSRSQELMMVLYKNGMVPYSVTIDGMARKISFLYEKYPAMLRDYDKFKFALGNSHMIDQRKRTTERNHAATTPGVVIAPSGMLKGGTSRFYAENIINDDKSTINLVSYQIEGTPGKILLEKGQFVNDDDPENGEAVKSEVNHFDFSSHSGKTDLIALLSHLQFKGEKLVFCVHGDKEVMESFSENITGLGFHTEIPLEGQTFKI